MLNAITNTSRKEKIDLDYSSRSSSVVSACSGKQRSPFRKESCNKITKSVFEKPLKDNNEGDAINANSPKETDKDDILKNNADVNTKNDKVKRKGNNKRNSKVETVDAKINNNIIKNGDVEHLSSHSSSATSSTERQKKGKFLELENIVLISVILLYFH